MAGEKFYPVSPGGRFSQTSQGVPSYLRKSGGPYGRGAFRFTWRGGYISTAITDAMEQAMKEQATVVRNRLRRELHKWPKHRKHELSRRAFARVELRGDNRKARVLIAGSNARYTVYHELGTSRFIGHPQIRQIMDEERLQLAPRIRARVAQLRGGQ